MTVIPRALLVGNDEISLRSWKMILDIQFKVTVSCRIAEAVSQVEGKPFDLVVICGDPENWKEIAELASSKNPPVKIVAVTLKEDEYPAWVDAAICSMRGSYELLKLCAGLFGLGSTVRAHGFSLGGSTIYTPKRLKADPNNKAGGSERETF
jgi:hypothetical protein